MTWHTVAGLSRKMYLPDAIKFTVALVPATQTNQRPGYKLWGNPKWIQHETGNTNAGAKALMHNRYLQQGAPDQFGNSQQLSYHFCTDDFEIYQCVPLDEVTWQAACGACQGNYGCFSCEMAVSVDTNKVQARDVTEWLAAATLEAANIVPVSTATVTAHYDWNNVYGDPNDPNRHRCPQYMMFIDHVWPTFQQNVITKHARIVALRAAETDPVPPPPPPVPIFAAAELPTNYDTSKSTDHPADNMKYRNRTVYICRRNYRCVASKGAGRTVTPEKQVKGAKPAGPRVAKGEKVFGYGLWVNPDDNVTYILEETGNWLRASSFTPRVRIDPRSVDAA